MVNKRGSLETIHYNLEVETEVWKKFKGTLNKDIDMNTAVVNLIKKEIQEN